MPQQEKPAYMHLLNNVILTKGSESLLLDSFPLTPVG